ncbi:MULTISPECIES: hypothetical protein [Streptomyces]|jgi:hypothetical protein|uniref:Uncharacterized protein n=1 Tax=Streptomyces thermogriseus TaxID=75292 RepID=A0ABN1T2A4_9ACTN|nr:hypothetical protein [Streptomyces thermovulgaris]
MKDENEGRGDTATGRATRRPAAQQPETGWAEARRLGRKKVRTWLPAVEDRSGPPRNRTGPEWNIVRGED